MCGSNQTLIRTSIATEHEDAFLSPTMRYLIYTRYSLSLDHVHRFVIRMYQLSATRHLNTDSDTELISELFGMELAARRPTMGPVVTADLLFEVVQVQFCSL